MEAEDKRKAGFSSDNRDGKFGGDRPASREGFRKGPARSFGQKPFGGPRREEGAGDGERKPFQKGPRSFGDRERPEGGAGRFGSRPERSGDGEGKPFQKGPRSFGDRERPEGGAPRTGSRPERSGDGERKPFQKGPRSFGDRERPAGGAPRTGSRPERSGDGERKPFQKGPRSFGDRDRPGPGSRAPKPGLAKTRLGTQAPEQAKEFRRKGADSPDYDEKKMAGIAAGRVRRPLRKKGEDPKMDEQLVRLNRFIAQSGLCSRREADDLISTGQITVNGKVMDQMGYLVKPDDVVKYGRRLLNKEKLVYVLLNKPKDFLTTTDDPEERKTVMSLVENACKERIYPVGRLDRNTTGLLLLTNDGELSERLMHPSHNIRKIYQVDLDKPLTANDEAAVRAGVVLEDGKAPVDELEVLSKERDILGLSIHIGRNRIVRRIFESLGYTVIRLDRVMYAGLSKKDLPRGTWRYLTEKEVINLKYFS